ncbi:MAG: PEP-CTERM sorting domain-containing protein [Bryobacterales bacterium]|nr:PEP-CTERM sorting domain-containing protein [Bryobacterales bacterium]
MPLAAAVAMSMGSANAAATFNASTAQDLCDNGTLGFTDLGTTGGVTGIKVFSPSGGTCSASGSGSAFLSVGAAGLSGGTFDANLEQLLVSFEFTGTMLINSEVPADYAWTLSLFINSGDAFGTTDGVANDGETVSGSLLVDMTPVAGQSFDSWALILQMQREDPEGATPFFIAVNIPENSIDITGVTPTVGDVPEPGTIGLMIAGGLAFLVRRRMVQ